MAVVQVSSAASRADYEKIAGEVGLEADVPADLICHAVAETPDGEVLIVDVWTSKESLQDFAERRLFPAFTASGHDALLAGVRPQAHEAFELVFGRRS